MAAFVARITKNRPRYRSQDHHLFLKWPLLCRRTGKASKQLSELTKSVKVGKLAKKWALTELSKKPLILGFRTPGASSWDIFPRLCLDLDKRI
jgi:hypothetical protein